MRHSSGLRNRYRPNGRSSYARQGKRVNADRYGKYVNGRQVEPERIGKGFRNVDCEPAE